MQIFLVIYLSQHGKPIKVFVRWKYHKKTFKKFLKKVLKKCWQYENVVVLYMSAWTRAIDIWKLNRIK